MAKINAFLLAILLGVMLSGCASTGPQKPIHATKAAELYEDTETVVILDSTLRKQIYLVDESASWTNDARLIVKARFMNKTKYLLRLQVQTLFKNKEGATSDETNWELILIPANGYYYYETTALNNRAEKYTIRLKPAKSQEPEAN